ncbi:MAG: SEC-C metal-binding domain-containing protein, partial [Candidatus Uhrbacteria bacterium]
VYRKRRAILDAEDGRGIITEMIEEECERIVAAQTHEDVASWDLDALRRAAAVVIPVAVEIEFPKYDDSPGKVDAAARRHSLVEVLVAAAQQTVDGLRERVQDDVRFQEVLRAVALRAIDQLWLEHLEAIEHLRQGIGLRGYGQRDPLVEYKREAYRLFTELLALMQQDTVRTLMHIIPASAQLESVFAKRQMQLAGAQKTMEKGRQLMAEAGGQPDPPASSRGGAAQPPKRITEVQQVEPTQKQRDEHGEKVGRNNLCPCGSGKKYKRCHGQ